MASEAELAARLSVLLSTDGASYMRPCLVRLRASRHVPWCAHSALIDLYLTSTYVRLPNACIKHTSSRAGSLPDTQDLLGSEALVPPHLAPPQPDSEPVAPTAAAPAGIPPLLPAAILQHQQQLKSALCVLVNLVESSVPHARRLAVGTYASAAFVLPARCCVGRGVSGVSRPTSRPVSRAPSPPPPARRCDNNSPLKRGIANVTLGGAAEIQGGASGLETDGKPGKNGARAESETPARQLGGHPAASETAAYQSGSEPMDEAPVARHASGRVPMREAAQVTAAGARTGVQGGAGKGGAGVPGSDAAPQSAKKRLAVGSRRVRRAMPTEPPATVAAATGSHVDSAPALGGAAVQSGAVSALAADAALGLLPIEAAGRAGDWAEAINAGANSRFDCSRKCGDA